MRLSTLAIARFSVNPVAQVLISVALTVGSMILEHYARKVITAVQKQRQLRIDVDADADAIADA